MPTKFSTFVVAILLIVGATLVPPTAAAQPPGFPDVNAFTPVDPQGYVFVQYLGSEPGNYTFNVHFSTSEGVACVWTYIHKGMENPNAYAGIRCMGDIPGIPDSVPDNGGLGCARVVSAPFSHELVFDRHWGDCPPFPPGVPSLNAGQKIETGNATCVVGGGNLTACIDPVHDSGFVLQPSGSWVF